MESPDRTKESGRTPGHSQERTQKTQVRPVAKEKCFNERRESKLPRIVKPSSRPYKAARNVSLNLNDKYDDSGDSVSSTLTATSRVPSSTPSIKEEPSTPERVRPSHIPRRKFTRDAANASNACCETTKKQTFNQFAPETKNVQRVQMLLNPEFCSENRRESLPESIATTRPIPTLGQIYGRINMIDSDRLNDWFLELNTPMNFMATSTPNNTELESDANTDQTSSIAVPVVVAPVNGQQEDMKRSTIVFDQNIINSQIKSENYVGADKLWMTSELEFPTRDTESGYHTISLKNHSKQSQSDVQSVQIHNTYCLGLVTESTNKALTVNPESSGGTSSLREQHTVVLSGTPDTVKGTTEESTNVSNRTSPMKQQKTSTGSSKANKPYPSNVQHSVAHVARIPVSSYTECLSEILQKTTNFEVMEGLESQKSPSSAAVTDTELHDNLSTGPTDEYVTDHHPSDWCRHNHHNSNGNMTFDVNSDIGTGNWSCRCEDELTCVSSSEYHPQRQYWNWKHELSKKYYEDSKMNEHRKKAQRFKRFPSNRYKLPRTFVSWRRRLSLRRICRRRWNHVWKKTAERWAIWSRSPGPKFRNCKSKYIRVMHYLQRSIIWEDADVQTNVLVYNEIGTDSGLREQKSAALSAIVNMSSLHSVFCQRSETTSTKGLNRSRFKHVNLGPSIFPFWYRRRSLNLQTSDYQGQSSTQYSSFIPEKQSNRTEMDNFMWNPHLDLGLSACNSVKSCQYDAALPKPVGVNQSTSLDQLNEFPQDDEGTETCDLSCYSNKTVTTDPFSRYRLPCHMDPQTSKDVYTPNLITCQNAETVTFSPNLESSTTGTLTSGSDITYYRPVIGTDIEFLISEKGTQALRPILKNANVSHEQELSIDAQISPNDSAMVSESVSTTNLKVNEQTTSFVQTVSPTATGRSVRIDDQVKKHSFATQAEETHTRVTSAETETQMTPYLSKEVMSTGITAVTESSMSEKASRFISACLLLDSYPSKLSDLPPLQPKLALTAPKIMSISSKTLADKHVSNTDLVTCQEVAESCEPEPASAACLAVAKCACKSTVAEPNTALKNADTITDKITDITQHNLCLSRNTSTRGLDSYYETEILLNNLIKKALVGDMSLRSSPFSNQSNPNFFVTTVNTCCGPDTCIYYRKDASIQHSKEEIVKPKPDYCDTAQACSSQLMSMCMLNVNSSISTQTPQYQGTLTIEVVPPTPEGTPSYSHPGSPKPKRPQLKCAEVMTSYNGFTRAIQVPASLATLCHNSWTSDDKCACASIHYHDMQTNTDYTFMSNYEQPTQTSYIRCQKRNPDYMDPPKKSFSAKPDLQSSANRQLMSLSRLIGKKKPSTVISCPPMTKLFSSDFSNDKWVKKTESSDYNSMTGIDPCLCIGDLNSDCSCTNNTHTIDERPSIDVPPVILSKDSLADVLPLRSSYIVKPSVKYSKTSKVMMVDQVTSDENLAKDVKESILQACPEICEAGTESGFRVYPQKSASVLTTLCVLPRPPPCAAVVDDSNRAECVFVYGEPRCAIHKMSADAGVQSEPSSVDADSTKRRDKREKKYIPQCVLTSYTEKSQKNKCNGEHIMPPKVYKALYDTSAKLAVNSIQQTLGENTKWTVDAEVDAANFHVPMVRSAGVVTSSPRGLGIQRCHCKDSNSRPTVTYPVTKTVDTKGISVKLPTKAKLLQTPDSDKEKSVCLPGQAYCDECIRTHILTSCRYFNNLVTKHIGRVKDNCEFLTSDTEKQLPLLHLDASLEKLTKQATEAFLKEIEFPIIEELDLSERKPLPIKPAGTSDLAVQTRQRRIRSLPSRLSGNVLSPSTSVTDIGKDDKDHLKSVYYMLTAIEGRLRRLKLANPNNKDLTSVTPP